MSVLRLLLVATVFVACVAQEDSANAVAPSELTNAVEAFRTDVWELITTKNFQWVVAIFGLIFGAVALIDGKQFFQLLVLISVAAVNFCFALSQLSATWTGSEAAILKYVVSVEFGLFVGLAAKKGWECTQLLLGLVIGLYLFHNFQGIASAVPHVKELAVHSVWITVVCTLMVYLGCWAVNERQGAGRVMGIVTPLFGSSLVVATIGYLVMLVCASSDIGNVAPSAVPSVVEFWHMIACPMHSQAVGIFRATDTSLTLGPQTYSIDRTLGIFFWIVIFFLGMKYQLKVDSEERQKASNSLKARLLAPKSQAIPFAEKKPIDVEAK